MWKLCCGRICWGWDYQDPLISTMWFSVMISICSRGVLVYQSKVEKLISLGKMAHVPSLWFLTGLQKYVCVRSNYRDS